MSKRSVKVKIWGIESKKSKKDPTKIVSHAVRWFVNGEEFFESFKKYKPAEVFRGKLLIAQSDGQGFSVRTGLPPSMEEPTVSLTWLEFAVQYVDMKAETLGPHGQSTTAEALIRITSAFIPKTKATPSLQKLRSMLRTWAFNPTARAKTKATSDTLVLYKWLLENSLPVDSLEGPGQVRAVVQTVTHQLNGKEYSSDVINRTRGVLTNIINYAIIEANQLEGDPFLRAKWPKTNTGAVAKREVINQFQANMLIDEIGRSKNSGPMCKVFYALTYYAFMRPEEAKAIKKSDLRRLPKEGFGWIWVEDAKPEINPRWTKSGDRNDERGLKGRAQGVGRWAPSPETLTKIIWDYVDKHGFGSDGLLVRGAVSRILPSITYGRALKSARETIFSEEFLGTNLAEDAYHFRKAGISYLVTTKTVDAETAALWAGNSAKVILDRYSAPVWAQEYVAADAVKAVFGITGEKESNQAEPA